MTNGYFKLSFISAVLSLLALGSVFLYWPHDQSEITAHQESAYERVMRTKTIRCGYAVYPPFINRGLNSGKLSGISYEYVEAIGKALHLKIEWSEETGWENFPVALRTGRIDSFCTGAWPNASRALEADFVRPYVYQPVYAYARADDHHFDNALANINDASITVATMDGEMSSVIAASDFPAAKTDQLPQLASLTELLVNVTNGKANVTFVDSGTAARYAASNPGKIRRVEAQLPLRVFGVTLPIAQGEERLRRVLDTTTEELLNSGSIEKIIAKYEEFPGTLLRVAPQFQSSPANYSPQPPSIHEEGKKHHDLHETWPHRA